MVGEQVPLSYEDGEEMMRRWSKHPHAQLHLLGKSVEGRNSIG